MHTIYIKLKILSKTENCGSVCRKRIGDGIILAVALLFHGAECRGLVAPFIEAVAVIQHQGIGSALRYAHTVVRPFHRSEIDDK